MKVWIFAPNVKGICNWIRSIMFCAEFEHRAIGGSQNKLTVTAAVGARELQHQPQLAALKMFSRQRFLFSTEAVNVDLELLLITPSQAWTWEVSLLGLACYRHDLSRLRPARKRFSNNFLWQVNSDMNPGPAAATQGLTDDENRCQKYFNAAKKVAKKPGMIRPLPFLNLNGWGLCSKE